MMQQDAFHLQIITPKHTFFDGEVTLLVVNLPDGEMGILKGHAPMAAAVSSGEVRFTTQGQTRHAAVSDGFLSVGREGAVMTVLAAEWPEDIDVARAQEQERIARERLRQRQSVQEYEQARMMLTRAMVRLRVSGEQDRVNQ